MITRFLILLLAMASFAAVSFNVSSDTNTATEKFEAPNIIYINIDDMGWSDLGCQGSTYYETPNIDQFAKEGMRFTNAYAAAANCAPSRACAMTGQYGPRHGVYTVGNSARGSSKDRKLIPTKNTVHISKDKTTMATVLKANGYTTCVVGKWHLSNDAKENGFDVNVGGHGRGAPRTYFSPYKLAFLEDGPKGEYLTDRLTTEAINFVTENKDKKFFLYLPYYTVHTPIQGKKEKVAKYAKKAKTKNHFHPTYAAMVESMDENVGRLFKAVKKLGLEKNTFILFSSDNGGHKKYTNQYPLRAGKGAYYEGGIREPLIVKWPEHIKAGSRSDTPVVNVDFFPTFLKVAGITKPKDLTLDGVDISSVLLAQGALKERALFWHFPIYLQAYLKNDQETRDPIFRTRPGSVVRKGDWKLHEYFEDGDFELYNLKEDIGEKNNLISKNPQKAAELKKLLNEWRQATKAAVPTKLNPNFGKKGADSSKGKNKKRQKKGKK